MSALVRIVMLMVTGLALGIALNTWPGAQDARLLLGNSGGAAELNLPSYASGLIVGMILWQISSVRWATLPRRLRRFFMSQMQFYQFVVMGSACVLVLIYF